MYLCVWVFILSLFFVMFFLFVFQWPMKATFDEPFLVVALYFGACLMGGYF